MIVGGVAGLFLFVNGFRKLKLKRTISGMATSKIRALAMGTVELTGHSKAFSALTDPIFKQPCVFFKIEILEQHGSGKNSHWKTIYRADSSNLPFTLVDDTGEILIFPRGAQLQFEKDINLTLSSFRSFFSSGNGPLESFVLRVVGSSMRTRKITASIVREHEPIYVLGYACPPERNLSAAERASASPIELARLLKSDTQRMQELDTNNDNHVDAEEWEAGLKKLRGEMEQKASQEGNDEKPSPLGSIFIQQGPDGIFLLADKTEKELLAEVGWASTIQIALGIICVLAVIFALFKTLS